MDALRSPDGDGQTTANGEASTSSTAGRFDDDAPTTVGLEALPALAAASDTAGLPTTFTLVGEVAPVPALVQVNLYRIAQESLTNARRHAGVDATADVRLRYDATHVELEVVNTGRLITAVDPGLGLRGMRERASISHGEIELSPRERGGFRVRVRVPLKVAGALG